MVAADSCVVGCNATSALLMGALSSAMRLLAEMPKMSRQAQMRTNFGVSCRLPCIPAESGGHRTAELRYTSWRLAPRNSAKLKTDFILANPPFNLSQCGGLLRQDKCRKYSCQRQEMPASLGCSTGPIPSPPEEYLPLSPMI